MVNCCFCGDGDGVDDGVSSDRQHEEALRIYVTVFRDDALAEQYCDTVVRDTGDRVGHIAPRCFSSRCRRRFITSYACVCAYVVAFDASGRVPVPHSRVPLCEPTAVDHFDAVSVLLASRAHKGVPGERGVVIDPGGAIPSIAVCVTAWRAFGVLCVSRRSSCPRRCRSATCKRCWSPSSSTTRTRDGRCRSLDACNTSSTSPYVADGFALGFVAVAREIQSAGVLRWWPRQFVAHERFVFVDVERGADATRVQYSGQCHKEEQRKVRLEPGSKCVECRTRMGTLWLAYVHGEFSSSSVGGDGWIRSRPLTRTACRCVALRR